VLADGRTVNTSLVATAVHPAQSPVQSAFCSYFFFSFFLSVCTAQHAVNQIRTYPATATRTDDSSKTADPLLPPVFPFPF
jgi:hypothetical protein